MIENNISLIIPSWFSWKYGRVKGLGYRISCGTTYVGRHGEMSDSSLETVNWNFWGTENNMLSFYNILTQLTAQVCMSSAGVIKDKFPSFFLSHTTTKVKIKCYTPPPLPTCIYILLWYLASSSGSPVSDILGGFVVGIVGVFLSPVGVFVLRSLEDGVGLVCLVLLFPPPCLLFGLSLSLSW